MMTITRRRGLWLGAAGAAVVAAAAGGAAWAWRGRTRALPRSLLLAGSSSMYPLNEALLQEFTKVQPQVSPVLQAGGSLAGLIALKRGAIDVAAMSRDLTEDEDTSLTRGVLIAINEVSILVHPASPVRGLGRGQLRSILIGETVNWRSVGGPNAPIHVLSRPDGASALRYLETELLQGEEIVPGARVLAREEEVAQAVARDPHAIGFISGVEPTGAAVRRLEVDGVSADRGTVMSGRYPLTQPLYLVLHAQPSAAARDFVAFAQGPQGQAIARRLGLIAVG